jgi:hypothetical protein
VSGKKGAQDGKEVEGVAGGDQQKVECRGIKTTCQSLIYYKLVWFDSISAQLTQGYVKLASFISAFRGRQRYIYVHSQFQDAVSETDKF